MRNIILTGGWIVFATQITVAAYLCYFGVKGLQWIFKKTTIQQK